MSSSSDSPLIFRKKFLPVWIALFITSLVVIYLTHGSNGLEADDAVSFLMTDVGMLVTMVTVTMAMTMLEIQFRAQSYTMLSIIQHVRDKVIYGFVLVSLSTITFVLLPLNYPNVIDPLIAAPYAAVATVFTLIYMVGYVYYMIGKAQPEKVIKNIIDDVISIEPDDIIKHATEEKKIKIFHVWEHLMLRAVKTDNTYVFKAGISPMISTAHRDIEKCDEKEKDAIGRMFFQHLHPVVLASVRSDRDRFIRLFMDNLYEYSEEIPKETAGYSARRLMMFHLWHHVMREASNRDNTRIMKYGMRTMHKILNDKKDDDKLHACAFFHSYLRRLVEYSFMNKSSEFLNLYLEKWSTYYNLLKNVDIKYQHTPLLIWESIMMKAASMGDCWTYGYGMSKISNIIKDDYKLTDSLSRVVKYAMRTDYSYVCIMSMLEEMEHVPDIILNKITIHAIMTGNMDIYEACVIKMNN